MRTSYLQTIYQSDDSVEWDVQTLHELAHELLRACPIPITCSSCWAAREQSKREHRFTGGRTSVLGGLALVEIMFAQSFLLAQGGEQECM